MKCLRGDLSLISHVVSLNLLAILCNFLLLYFNYVLIIVSFLFSIVFTL